MKIVTQKITENCHFYIREKLLYIAWACFRNVAQKFIRCDVLVLLAAYMSMNFMEGVLLIRIPTLSEPRCEKTGFLHMRKQSNCAADQRLCSSYIDTTIPLLSKSEISNL